MASDRRPFSAATCRSRPPRLQLDEALSALTRGDVEYLILEEGDCFLQVAGEGDGPYQVQRSDGGDTMHE